ncbi:MAG: hypothetical protein ACOYUB_04635 [Patescibacteria group bacterium]
MEAPFGITFLKKAELYNLSVRLDNEVKNSLKKESHNLPLWPIEKAILKWTYTGHRHLGSPLTTHHLSRGDEKNKLEDFGIIDENDKFKSDFKALEKTKLDQVYENIVVRGFGEYFNEEKDGHSAIVINKDGLLFGELLAELDRGNIITRKLVKLHYDIYGKLMNHLGGIILLIISTISIILLVLNFLEKLNILNIIPIKK